MSDAPQNRPIRLRWLFLAAALICIAIFVWLLKDGPAIHRAAWINSYRTGRITREAARARYGDEVDHWPQPDDYEGWDKFLESQYSK